MRTEELINLAKELAALDDLSDRKADVALLKRESRFLNNRDEETFSEKEMIDEFNKYYAVIASKESSLNLNTYQEKKELIARAKQILNLEDMRKATKEMNDTFDAFKSAGRCTKEQDDELWAEFKAVKDQFNEKRALKHKELEESFIAKRAAKEAVIEKAKKVLELENIKQAGEQMEALMNEWKAIGFSGKENDDALWGSFSELRKAYFEKRKAFYENMNKVFEERAVKKEELIKEAKVLLANSEFTPEEIAKVKEMRNRWSAIGFAGRDNDDKLWEAFNEVIKKYFDEMKFYKN